MAEYWYRVPYRHGRAFKNWLRRNGWSVSTRPREKGKSIDIKVRGRIGHQTSMGFYQPHMSKGKNNDG